jgi:TonB family protein
MRTISQLLLNFIGNATWQLALIAAVASICAWLLRGTSARQRYWLWVAALILSIGLPVLAGWQLLRQEPLSSSLTLSESATPVAPTAAGRESLASVDPASLPPPQPPRSRRLVSIWLAAVVVLMYLALLIYRSVRLVQAWLRTRAIRNSSGLPDLNETLRALIDRCETALQVTNHEIRSSSEVPVPITVGIRRPLVILPEQLLREANADVLTAAIGHELVHVQRRDYLRNLVYELIYLPLSFHPAAALVRRRIHQTRELSCDELVTERLLTAQVYAHSLVQLAGSAVPFDRSPTLTVGITDADILEVRIMSILNKSRLDGRRAKLLLLAASILLATPCVAATAFGLNFDIAPSETAMVTSQEGSQSTAGGKLVYRTDPEYTPDAREKKIEGTVELLATIGPNGLVQNVVVARPLYPSLDQSAVETLKKWRWEPATKDGLPVSRKVGVEMVFSLDEFSADKLKPKEENIAWAFEAQDQAHREELEKKARQEWEEREMKELSEQEGRDLKLRAEREEQEMKLRAELEGREMKLRTVQEGQEIKTRLDLEAALKLRAETDPEFRKKLEARARQLQEEQDEAVNKRAVLARTAKINMDQAIQIANSQYPGKVMECSLVGEHWESPGVLGKNSLVLYHVVVLSADDPKPAYTHVLVNAVDGTIFRASKEKRNQ